MSKSKKLLERFLNKPSDFTWRELVSLMGYLGFSQLKPSKTGGSRVKFFNDALDSMINLHKPHGPAVLKRHHFDKIIKKLKEDKVI